VTAGGLCFCIPIYEDWASVEVLLRRLDVTCEGAELRHADVLLIDDGSTSPAPEALAGPYQNLGEVKILRLRRNLGHQRAIAIGLTQLHEEGDYDHVVVMDGDGEDSPEDVPDLLERALERPGCAVFAKRARRSESLTFRAFYQAYRGVHRVLTGKKVEVGNFSVVPHAVLTRLVAVSELWNHYAAAVFNARVPIETVPLARGTRIDGRSQMNFISLAVHGLSAVSVYGEIIGVRLLLAACTMIGLSFLGLGTLLVLAVSPDVQLPTWTPLITIALLLIVFNALLLAIVFVFVTLQGRNSATFLPLRDWRFYVDKTVTLTARAGG